MGIKNIRLREFLKISYIGLVRSRRVIVMCAGLLLFSGEQHASEPEEYEMINFTAGQVGILDDMVNDQRYGIEYRFKSFASPFGFSLIPAVGAAVSTDGASFFYTDLRHDFFVSRQWILIPSFGVGVFKDSGDINLGNDLEFRSGLEVAYQFKNKVRAGIAVFHLSNGGISSQNPGTESLVFSICIPVIGS